MFHISTHISPAIEPEIHPHVETPHANDNGAPHTSAPTSVTPGTGSPSAGASGKGSGLFARLSAPSSEFAPFKLPGDPIQYYIKDSSGNGPRTLYTGDPQAGAYKQTNRAVVSDGNHGWLRDDGLKGAGGDKSKYKPLTKSGEDGGNLKQKIQDIKSDFLKARTEDLATHANSNYKSQDPLLKQYNREHPGKEGKG
jgi:hypothetical protein